MNLFARIAVVTCCLCLCGGAVVIAHLTEEGNGDRRIGPFGERDVAGDYKHVASKPAAKFDFSELESIILRDPSAKSQRARIEFGSAKIERGSALVEVLFFAPDGRMQPYLYKLTPEKKSWKVASVQRMWFVPRSHLLRGVRV
jgi:hypothetical protein